MGMGKIKKSITISKEAEEYIIQLASELSKKTKRIITFSEMIDILALFTKKIQKDIEELVDEIIATLS